MLLPNSCFVFIVVLCFVLFCVVLRPLQFSLRSRTPSMNGSIYSPYSSRKVGFFFVVNYFALFYFI